MNNECMNTQKKELMQKALKHVFQPPPASGLQRSDFHVHLNSDNKQLCDEIFWDLFIARIITPLSSAECLKGRFCRHSDAQANREKLARDQGLSLDT
jgi:hypothetical protein